MRLLLIVLRKVAFDCYKRRTDKFNGEMLPEKHYWHHISKSVELSHSSVLLPYSSTLKCKQWEVLG